MCVCIGVYLHECVGMYFLASMHGSYYDSSIYIYIATMKFCSVYVLHDRMIEW